MERVRGGARALGRGRRARTRRRGSTGSAQAAGGQGGDRRASGDARRQRLDDLPRRVVDAPSRSPRRLTDDPPYELTLVTNSPMIAAEIRADPIHVVVCPGELDQHTRTVTGRWTAEFIRRLNFDIAFVSAAGHHARGRAHHLARAARRRAQRRARRRPARDDRRSSTRRSSGARRSSRSRPRRTSTSSSATTAFRTRSRASSVTPACGCSRHVRSCSILLCSAGGRCGCRGAGSPSPRARSRAPARRTPTRR